MPTIPDLVHLSRLQIDILANAKEIRQIIGANGTSPGRRRVREEQTWLREKQLGRGGFGTVLLERCTRGVGKGSVRAVKELRKAANVNYNRELEAAALFSHTRYEDSFVKSFGWYETADCIYMTMKYLSHGDLQQYVGKLFPESECQLILTQVPEALDFMHERGFTHRDLKPPNILVSAPGPDWWVKLSDFGISKRAEAGVTSLHTQVFTPGFAAPEIFFMYMMEDGEDEAAYTEAVDVWSAGVVALLLLSAEAVFDNRRALLRYCKGKHDPVAAALEKCSLGTPGQNLIKELLAPLPRDRPSAKESLQRDWLLDSFVQPSENPEIDSRDIIEAIEPLSLRADDSSFFEPSAKWSEISEADDIPTAEESRKSTSSMRQVFNTAMSSARKRIRLRRFGTGSATAEEVLIEDRSAEAVKTNASSLSNPNEQVTPARDAHTNPASSSSTTAQVNRSNEPSEYKATTEAIQTSPASPRYSEMQDNSVAQAGGPASDSGVYTLEKQATRDSGYASVERLAWRDGVTLSEDTDAITTLAFCPGGKYLVSAAENNVLRVWDVNTARLVSTRRLPERSSAIEHIAIASDGEATATRSESGQILLWDLIDGEAEPTLQIASKSEYGSPPVTFSSDGQFVAWIDLDGAVNVRNVQTGALQTTVTHTSANVTKFKGNVSTFAFSPNNEYILSGSDEGSSDPVCLWGLHTGGRVSTLLHSPDQDLGIWQVAFSAACHMAAARSDRFVVLWDARGRLLHRLHSKTARANDLAFSPDCNMIVIPIENNMIWTRYIERERVVGEKTKHSEVIEAVAFSSDGKFIATASQDSVGLWDAKRQRLRFIGKGADLTSKGCFAFSPNGQVLAWRGSQKVRLLDLRPFSDETRIEAPFCY